MCNIPLLDSICRESYNDPLDLYKTLKSRGMDLVTVTDHDSIDAAEQLRRFPDFFLSEEVTCTTGSGTEIHMGVYAIEERHHEELQRRRRDLASLLAYLEEQKLFFSINHVFSSLTGPRTHDDFACFEEHFPAFETLNGQMLEAANRSAAALAARLGKAQVGGSDAHTLHSLGRTFTEVRGAADLDTFMGGLRHGRSTVHGEHGDYIKLTRAVWTIGVELIRERNWAAVMAPLMALVPAVILVNYLREMAFERKWSRLLNSGAAVPTEELAEAA
jgi:predicted metal-dependent phosphoesterase TrpH